MRSGLSTSKPPSIDWASLDAKGAPLPVQAVSAALRERYGLTGRLELLARERDDVYRLEPAIGPPQVVRVSAAAEPAESLALQNAALRTIARENPSLPVPRVVVSVDGNEVEVIRVDGDHRLRVLTFLPGMPVFHSPRSGETLRSIGRTLALLDRALEGLADVGGTFPLLWDVRSAPQLRDLVNAVADTRARATVDRVLSELESDGLARLGALPAQVIHNDLNPKNVLFDPADSVRVAGIIDFGDVVHGARIIDLGVAVARHLEPDAPMRAPPHVVAGYSEVTTILPEELRVLPLIVRTRLAMRAVIASWRHQLDAKRGDPAQIRGALSLLEAMSAVGDEQATRQWADVAKL